MLYQTIIAVAEKVSSGENIRDTEAWAIEELKNSSFGKVDYITVRDAQSLLPPSDLQRPMRVLAAARLGRARLIDNIAI